MSICPLELESNNYLWGIVGKLTFIRITVYTGIFAFYTGKRTVYAEAIVTL